MQAILKFLESHLPEHVTAWLKENWTILILWIFLGILALFFWSSFKDHRLIVKALKFWGAHIFLGIVCVSWQV